MSLFDRLLAPFRKHDGFDTVLAKPEPSDLRTYDRYHLRRDAFAGFEVKESGEARLYQIRDMSYGGLSIAHHASEPELPRKTVASLRVLDQRIDVTFERIHSKVEADGYRTYGVALRHEGAESLVFLRDILENFHKGSSLLTIDRSILSEEYADERWTCLRGEGPCDLKIESGPGSQIAQVLLTFRADGHYHEISYREGRELRTATALAQPGPSNRMEYDVVADKAILRLGLYITYALRDEKAKALCHGFYSAIVRALDLESSKGAA